MEGLLNQAAAGRPDPRAPLAAFFSFVLPGLGQAYNRQFWLALLLGLPAAVLGWIVWLPPAAARAAHGAPRCPGPVGPRRPQPRSPRLAGSGHLPGPRGPRDAGLAPLDDLVRRVLLAATLAMHLLPAWYASATLETLAAVGQGGSGAGGIWSTPSWTPRTGPAPLVATPPPAPSPSRRRLRSASPIGSPSSSSAWTSGRARTYNTDTMMVATIDPGRGVADLHPARHVRHATG